MLSIDGGRPRDGERCDSGNGKVLHLNLLWQRAIRMHVVWPAINLQFGNTAAPALPSVIPQPRRNRATTCLYASRPPNAKTRRHHAAPRFLRLTSPKRSARRGRRQVPLTLHHDLVERAEIGF